MTTTPQPENESERLAGPTESETEHPDSAPHERGSRIRERVQNIGFGLATAASGLDLVGYDDLALALWAGSMLLLVAASERTNHIAHVAWSSVTQWASPAPRE